MLTTLSVAVVLVSLVGIGLGVSRRTRFVGQVAIGLNVLVALLAVASTIPHFVLSPCE
jgi:hypothetical protein